VTNRPGAFIRVFPAEPTNADGAVVQHSLTPSGVSLTFASSHGPRRAECGFSKLDTRDLKDAKALLGELAS
jgi:hypothetical protein